MTPEEASMMISSFGEVGGGHHGTTTTTTGKYSSVMQAVAPGLPGKSTAGTSLHTSEVPALEETETSENTNGSTSLNSDVDTEKDE